MISEGGGPRVRAIQQKRYNQGAIHVDIGSYGGAVFAKKSGFDRRHIAKDEEPSFVIRDPIYVKKFTNCTCLLYIWQIVGRIRG